MVTLHIVSLVFGLASVGSLFLAVTTDYWLYTSEPFDFEKMILEGQAEITGEEFPPDVLQVRIHLYRASASTVRQSCDDASSTVLTENNGVAPE